MRIGVYIYVGARIYKNLLGLKEYQSKLKMLNPFKRRPKTWNYNSSPLAVRIKRMFVGYKIPLSKFPVTK